MLFIYPLMLGTWEIVAIVLVVLLLFGGKKIPELMKGLGKGVKSFKQGMNEVEKEIKELDEEGYKVKSFKQGMNEVEKEIKELDEEGYKKDEKK